VSSVAPVLGRRMTLSPGEAVGLAEAAAKPEPAIGKRLAEMCLYASQEDPACLEKRIAEEVKSKLENDEHYKKRHNALSMVFVAVILLSMVLKEVRDWTMSKIKAREDEHQLKMVNALFEELMTLGCIALLGSVLIRLGVIDMISGEILGSPPKDAITATGGHGDGSVSGHSNLVYSWAFEDLRAGHCISELTMLFEDVHLLIFAVMAGLVGTSAINMHFVNRNLVCWAESEDILLHSDGTLIKALGQIAERHAVARGIIFAQRRYEHMIRYVCFRSEFLEPSDGLKPRGVSTETFNFHEYMKYLCGEAIAWQVEIPFWCYIVLLLGLLTVRPLFRLRGFQATGTFVIATAIIALCFWLLDSKLRHIEAMMAPSCKQVLAVFRDPQVISRTERDMAIRKLLGNKAFRSLESLDRRRFVWLRQLLNGTSSPTQQEQLFWFQRRGSDFIWASVRVLLLLQSLVLGVVGFHVLMFPYTWRAHWPAAVVIALLSILIFHLYHTCVIRTVLVTSTELMTRSDVVDAVNARNRQRAQTDHLHLLQKIKAEAVRHSLRKQRRRGDLGEWLQAYSALPDNQRQTIESRWRAYATDPSGLMSLRDFRHALKSVGKTWAEFVGHEQQWIDCLVESEVGTASDSQATLMGFHGPYRPLDEQSYRVLMVAIHQAQMAALREVDAVEVLRDIRVADQSAPYGAAASPSQSDGAARDARFDAAALEHLARWCGLHSKLRAGMPAHADARELLRMIYDRTQPSGDTMPEAWEAPAEALTHYLRQLDRQVNFH